MLVGHSNHGVVFANASSNATYGNWIGLTGPGTIVANHGFGVYLLNASNNTVQLPSRSVQAGRERNIFGQNVLGATGMSGTSTGNVIDLTPEPPKLDLNGDAKSDYVLYQSSTHHTLFLYLNHNVFTSSAPGPTLPVGWKLVDVRRLNRDTHPDYLLFNVNTHQTVIWYLSGPTRTGIANGPTIPVGYEPVDGDFNSDGSPDYLLYNAATRRTVVWYLNNSAYTGSIYGPTRGLCRGGRGRLQWQRTGGPGAVQRRNATNRDLVSLVRRYVSGAYSRTIAAGYTLVGVGDFSGDTKPDFVLYNASTRQTAIWYLNNNVYTAGATGPTLASGYGLSRALICGDLSLLWKECLRNTARATA